MEENKKKYDFAFLGMLLVQIGIIVYFFNTKAGLFGDEIWSFNLANNYYAPYLGDASQYFNKWLDSGFWNNSIVVAYNHTFAYDSVVYNQSVDCHPPLYYMLLHTICSFFPGVFNKWFGLAINMFFFVASQIVLYKFCSKNFQDRLLALLICAFYGFSWGTINNITYIRMYVMLAFWCIMSFCLHIDLLKRFSIKKLIYIFIVSFLGIMTQYHFLVYQFFVSAYFVIYLVFKKHFKNVLQYIFAYIVLFPTVYFTFPAIIGQIFGTVGEQTPQGQIAMNNLMNSRLFEGVKVYGHILSKDMFGAHIKLTALLVCCLFVLGILRFLIKCSIKYDNKCQALKIALGIKQNEVVLEYKFSSQDELVVYAVLVIIPFFLIISKVSHYLVTRYMVPIHHLIAIVFIFYLKNIISLFSRSKKILTVIVMCFVVICASVSYNRFNLFEYDYDIKNVFKEFEKDKANSTYIVLIEDASWWPTINKLMVLREAKNSYLIETKNMNSLPDVLNKKKIQGDRLFIYRGYGGKLNEKDFMSFCREQLGYSKIQEISSYHGKTYMLSEKR